MREDLAAIALARARRDLAVGELVRELADRFLLGTEVEIHRAESIDARAGRCRADRPTRRRALLTTPPSAAARSPCRRGCQRRRALALGSRRWARSRWTPR